MVKNRLGQAAELSIVELVDEIILGAVEALASDIHIELTGEHLRIRYRLDGILTEIQKLPRETHAALLSRIKIMSALDIAEKRLPQDGRLNFSKKPNLDIRVATLPTILGEKVVLRLLDKTQQPLTVKNLGFSIKNELLFKELYKSPYGMLLITGPTGSGKTTTLYSMLAEINNIEKNIVTIEDPIEYRLAGINQVQVNQKAGLDFATGLRGILRQDPDIVLIGEIRDRETASIGVRAALTGHLVLSTLHTNDALGALPRLMDMGIENYLVVASVIGIISQRLVRKICPHCRESYCPTTAELAEINLSAQFATGVILYRGKGCAQCNFTGYLGRIALQEIIKVTVELREAIMQKKTKPELYKIIKKQGFRELMQDGLDKVLKGETTTSELLRVAYNIR